MKAYELYFILLKNLADGKLDPEAEVEIITDECISKLNEAYVQETDGLVSKGSFVLSE